MPVCAGFSADALIHMRFSLMPLQFFSDFLYFFLTAKISFSISVFLQTRAYARVCAAIMACR